MTSKGPGDLYLLSFTCCAEPMMLLSEEGRIVALNAAAERILSLPLAEARGQTLDEALSPSPPLAPLVDEARREHTARALPRDATLHLAPDRALSVEGSLSPLTGEGDALAGMLLTLRDVTEQRRAERRLRESEALFREVIDKLDSGVVVYDADERLVFHNPKCAEIYPQIAQLNTVGMKVEDLAREFGRRGGCLGTGLSEEEFVALRVAEHRRGAKNTLQRISGRWIRIDDARTESGSVISLRTDITALKEAEIALERERQFSRLVIDTNPNLIFVKDRQGRLLLVNKAAADTFKVSAEAMLGKVTGDMVGTPEQIAKLREVDEELFRTMKPITVEEPYTHRDGITRWTHVTKVPLVEPDGTVHLLGISVDITERRARDELLQRTIAELERQKQEIVDKLAVIQDQRELIEALSTPILQVAEGVVAIPVIGPVDAARAGEITSKLLDEISRTRARFAILDVTGMRAVDAEMAGHFVRMASAIRLLGAQGILTGIAPAVAQSICALGVDLSGITTRANLRAGLETCMRALAGQRPGAG